MIEAIANVTATGGSKPPQQRSAESGSESFAAHKPASKQESVPINPRLKFDAVSGVVITEFLDETGGLKAQSPSTAVLAYLRAGLGEDGRKKEE